MEKTVFILNQIGWEFNDCYYDKIGEDEFHKKYDSYEKALTEKIKLEIKHILNEPEALFLYKTHSFQDTRSILLGYVIKNFSENLGNITDDYLLAERFIELCGRNRSHIENIIEILDFQLFNITEVQESKCFYKIYTNPSFKDFEDEWTRVGSGYKVEYGEEGIFGEKTLYHSLEEAKMTMFRVINDLLSNGYCIDGSFKSISPMPELLESYIYMHPYFEYNEGLETISMKSLNNDLLYETMNGFIALLYPKKNPFIIKEISIYHLQKILKKDKIQKEKLQNIS